MGSEIDGEVRALIEAAHTEAWAVLNTYRDILDSLATALLEKETLERRDLEVIFAEVEKRPRITTFDEFGPRLPSDRPPIKTPGELAIERGEPWPPPEQLPAAVDAAAGAGRRGLRLSGSEWLQHRAGLPAGEPAATSPARRPCSSSHRRELDRRGTARPARPDAGLAARTRPVGHRTATTLGADTGVGQRRTSGRPARMADRNGGQVQPNGGPNGGHGPAGQRRTERCAQRHQCRTGRGRTTHRRVGTANVRRSAQRRSEPNRSPIDPWSPPRDHRS